MGEPLAYIFGILSVQHAQTMIDAAQHHNMYLPNPSGNVACLNNVQTYQNKLLRISTINFPPKSMLMFMSH